MTQRHDKTLIIGAGPAGLAAAMELSRAGEPFTLVERADAVGGLSRTYVFREGEGEAALEFRTDNGPHRFFSKNDYLYEFIGGVLSERWIKVRRRTRQWIAGHFFDYPVDPVQIARGLGPTMVAQILFDYALSIIKYRYLGAPILNFRDFAYASFGKALAEFNIINYTEKVWGIPTDYLHQDWAHQRIQGLNVTSIALSAARRLLAVGGAKPRSLVDEFYYPERGAGLVYEVIAERLREQGRPVRLQTQPTRVRHDGRRITTVTLQGPAGSEDVTVDHLIESVHLVDFIKLLDPPPPRRVLEAAARLRYRSQVYLFVTLDKERVSDDQWIYFPDASVPFERWSEMKNFSAQMAPAGKTSLFIEFFTFEDEAKWAMSAEQLLALVLPVAERGGFFRREHVRRAYLLRGGKDYPLYDLTYKDNLAIIKDWLDGLSNLYYIGRPGRFKYTNQDHSLEMGMYAAYSVIEGRRRDIESIGSGSESFERVAPPGRGNHQQAGS